MTSLDCTDGRVKLMRCHQVLAQARIYLEDSIRRGDDFATRGRRLLAVRHGAEPKRSIKKSRNTLTFGVRCRPGGKTAHKG
jgi:hypothetical protein